MSMQVLTPLFDILVLDRTHPMYRFGDRYVVTEAATGYSRYCRTLAEAESLAGTLTESYDKNRSMPTEGQW